MIGHDDLTSVRDHQVGGRNAPLLNLRNLPEQDGDIQRHAVADDIHDILVKGTGRKRVQGKFTIFVDNGMAGIGAALETDDHIRLLCQCIRNFAFSLISPVGAYDCFNHKFLLYSYSLSCLRNVSLSDVDFGGHAQICLIGFQHGVNDP